MSAGFAQITLRGNLTRDPEVTFTASNTAVCKFSVAMNETYTGSDGAKKEEVHYFDCVAWGKTGETIAQYFQKGKEIIVFGSLKQERWEDKEGGKRQRVTIRVDRFFFSGGRPAEDGTPPPAQSHEVAAKLPPRKSNRNDEPVKEVSEADIPF